MLQHLVFLSYNKQVQGFLWSSMVSMEFGRIGGELTRLLQTVQIKAKALSRKNPWV